MKQTLFTKYTSLIFLGSLLLFLTACSPKTVIPPDATNTAGSMDNTGNNINYPDAQNGGYSEDNLPREGTLDDTFKPNRSASGEGMLNEDMQSDEYKVKHGRSSANLFPVYFDFDQATVRSDMVDILADNAEYINSIPGAVVIIEGNCDERGTNEYNLALGERRAMNVKQFLTNLGVDPNRTRTLSYGEEKPLFSGQDEDSYAQNRRADFIVE